MSADHDHSPRPGEHAHTHDQAHRHGHGHAHGVVDPSIASTARGLWALKWSFAGLVATALLQVAVVALSGSVALLADTIHNFADAATAIPLGIAFLLARRAANRRFTYGLGRVKDFAGLVIVLTITASAAVAANEAVRRLIQPQPIELLWAVMLASVIGFLGNEAVAVFRIRVGRQIDPEVVGEIAHAVGHVPRVEEVSDVRARWVGHRLHVDVSVTVPGGLSVAEGHDVARDVRHQLLHHLPHLGRVMVHVDPYGQGGERHHRIGAHTHDGMPAHTHD